VEKLKSSENSKSLTNSDLPPKKFVFFKGRKEVRS